MTAERIVSAALRASTTNEARSRIDQIRICTAGYAEPGYTYPASGIIAFGNWNTVSKWNAETHNFDVLDDAPARAARLLDKLGVGLEWSDEWALCECGKAVRIKPDSYCWKGSYWQDDQGEIHCHECVRHDPADYLNFLEGKTSNAITLDLDLAASGYVLVQDDFEHGFHDGQDADPELIGAALREQGIERFIFRIDGVRQFDVAFSVWVHESKHAQLDVDAFHGARTDGPSPSAGLRQSLEDATRKMSELPDIPGHPKVAQCDTTSGTAKVRLVTPQEFVEGNALKF